MFIAFGMRELLVQSNTNVMFVSFDGVIVVLLFKVEIEFGKPLSFTVFGSMNLMFEFFGLCVYLG